MIRVPRFSFSSSFSEPESSSSASLSLSSVSTPKARSWLEDALLEESLKSSPKTSLSRRENSSSPQMSESEGERSASSSELSLRRKVQLSSEWFGTRACLKEVMTWIGGKG